jgi:hypothetical protein
MQLDVKLLWASMTPDWQILMKDESSSSSSSSKSSSTISSSEVLQQLLLPQRDDIVKVGAQSAEMGRLRPSLKSSEFMLLVAALVLVCMGCRTCQAQQLLRMSCWHFTGGTTSTSTGVDRFLPTHADGYPGRCVRYRFRCDNDMADSASFEVVQHEQLLQVHCTSEQLVNKDISSWKYGWTSSRVCEEMQKAPEFYIGLLCCSKNMCNEPITLPPVGSSSSSPPAGSSSSTTTSSTPSSADAYTDADVSQYAPPDAAPAYSAPPASTKTPEPPTQPTPTSPPATVEPSLAPPPAASGGSGAAQTSLSTGALAGIISSVLGGVARLRPSPTPSGNAATSGAYSQRWRCVKGCQFGKMFLCLFFWAHTLAVAIAACAQCRLH